jgi:hypothetical protein
MLLPLKGKCGGSVLLVIDINNHSYVQSQDSEYVKIFIKKEKTGKRLVNPMGFRESAVQILSWRRWFYNLNFQGINAKF